MNKYKNYTKILYDLSLITSYYYDIISVDEYFDTKETTLMKLGVVVEGGAARTYFAAGVMDILIKEGIKPDFVVGSAMGVAKALSYVSGQYGRSYYIGVHYSYRTKYSGIRHLLRPSNRCYYNLDFIFNKIPNEVVPFDYDAFNESGCEVLAAVTNMETGKAEYLPVHPDKDMDKVLLATWAKPILFPKVEIDGKRYMDGTYADPISYDKALQSCDKVIVITNREKHYAKLNLAGIKFAAWSCRKFPEFVNLLKNRAEIYHNCTERLKLLEAEGKVFVIRPDSTIGWKRIEYNPDTLRRIYRRGYNEAKQVIQQIRNYIDE